MIDSTLSQPYEALWFFLFGCVLGGAFLVEKLAFLKWKNIKAYSLFWDLLISIGFGVGFIAMVCFAGGYRYHILQFICATLGAMAVYWIGRITIDEAKELWHKKKKNPSVCGRK